MKHFLITHTAAQARVGRLNTARGVVKTPAFLPCATHGSLRGVLLSSLMSRASSTSEESLDYVGATSQGIPALDMILANAYHLYLRPGIDTIEKLGGLHTFMNWRRPEGSARQGTAIMTDSGGFQAFALPKFVKFSDEGILFRSHLDGSQHLFTPELVIDIQQRIGVDIATCLDVCTGFPVKELEVAKAVDQTNRWAETSIRQWSDVKDQMLLYGMVQGSIYKAQRQRSAEFLSKLPFSGFAIGGNMYTFGETIESLASEKPMMWDVLAYTTSLLPNNKPRHLLGVGEPSDIIAGVAAGIDTFDCVMATRIARHGSAWVRRSIGTWEYDRLNLSAAQFADSTDPIDCQCHCQGCTGYSRGYIRHLFNINDPLGGQLLSIHNIAFLQTLTHEIRESIIDDSFQARFTLQQLD